MKESRWRELGLKDSEYDMIMSILNREPNDVELGMYSVMWSEHCSYKNSRQLLKQLPTKGDRVLQGPGENAGIVDIGAGLAVVFKIESHNHPSFIEPYQGAATGVGGIIRDIFTMGARPVALLDSLRFGPLEDPKVRSLMEGVVAGIGGYGNCIGIPTVGGEIWFDECYRGNPLVNAMCVGIIEKEKIARGLAAGTGNLVVLVGAKTGRDGMHGVTFASEELGEASEDKRPAVQVGDPFMEKLLLEACLELIDKKVIVGIQDLGGAGLTCATSEMAGRAGTGMRIDLDKVPVREEGMSAYEIMLSESQERMLLVVEKEKVTHVRQVFGKWGLDAAVIGEVTDDGRLSIYLGGELAADVPARSLADGAPLYCPAAAAPAVRREEALPADDILKDRKTLEDVFLRLLSSPNIASKEWVFQQYDHMVRTATILLPGADAAVIRIRGTRKALAVTTDCNARYARLNPYRGAALAVCEAARNIACTGARPLAVTDCLNFGNPEKPEIYWQFTRAVAGLKDACLAFATPVTGGNVSFYNETEGAAIFPTPVVGMVGLIEDVAKLVTPAFKREGDILYLVGSGKPALAASEYLQRIYGLTCGEPPEPDLAGEKALQEALADLAEQGMLASAHDLAEGGLAAAAAECAFGGDLGFELFLDGDNAAVSLFGEGAPLVLVSVRPELAPELEKLMQTRGITCRRTGRVAAGQQVVIYLGKDNLLELPLGLLKNRWREALPCLLTN